MTAIEFTGFETTHHDRRYSVDGARADFTYIDPNGRRLHTVSEELIVSEQTCEGHRTEASVALPDPGSQAGPLLLQALLEAMALDEDYELVAKQHTAEEEPRVEEDSYRI